MNDDCNYHNFAGSRPILISDVFQQLSLEDILRLPEIMETLDAVGEHAMNDILHQLYSTNNE